MTLDEAIKNAEAVAEINQIIADAADGDKWSSASFESCAVKHRQFAEWLRELKERKEKDVPDMNVGDSIRRQDAIDATWEEPTYTDPINVLTEVRDRIKALPAAQPEIIRCKDCKHRHIKDLVWVCPFGLPGGENFFCGYGERADMRGDTDAL